MPKTSSARRDFLHLATAAASLPLLGLSVPAMAQIRDIGDAIDKAGRQRMLSERATKAWLAVGQGVRTAQADKVLGESMALFDRKLVELRAFAPTPEIKATYQTLHTVWGDHKTLLVGSTPSKAGAAAVLAQAEKVLELAGRGTDQIVAHSGRQTGRLVNVAGRQRMLSQHMAAMALGLAWGVKPELTQKELVATREEFVKAMQVLQSASATSAPIRAELDLVNQQWSFYDTAVKNVRPSSADTRLLGELFTTSERILQVMDSVTGQFAKLA